MTAALTSSELFDALIQHCAEATASRNEQTCISYARSRGFLTSEGVISKRGTVLANLALVEQQDRLGG